MFNIEIFNDQTQVPLDEARVRRAVQMILEDASVSRAEISVAVVDDETTRRLHSEYLDQDEPTDVLSFVLEGGRQNLEGEVVVGAETAAAMAPRFGFDAEDELLLYVIHGVLHLVGYDDTTAEKQAEMHRQEAIYLARFGLKDHCRPAGANPHPSDSHPCDSASGGNEIP